MTYLPPGIPGATVAELTVAMVADSLDAAGFRGQVMDAGLTSLPGGHRVYGPAATIEFVPVESAGVDRDPYGPAIDFIDALAPGSVVVIATGSDDRTAYWGELFSAAAIGRGAVGVVCDGPVRDVAKIRALGFPVFSMGSRPVDFRNRMRVAGCGVAVRCAGVPVFPGDLVFADDDGVAVIPVAASNDVLGRAVDRLAAEKSVLGDLTAGAALRAVWDTWGVL